MDTEISSPPKKKAKVDDGEDPGLTLTDDYVAQLGTCLGTTNKQATFACGGVIPILSRPGVGAVKETDTAHPVASTPVVLRWDGLPNADGNVTVTFPSCFRKLTFPLTGRDAEQGVKELLEETEPASFGRGSENVMDTNYRKATKMDPEMFSTTFNPYDLGIIDTIAQMLLPSALDSNRYRGVRAELYKLNIYTAPSGRFKPHIDTPRSERQFGSLVVCLPAPHEGGQLAVRHSGREMTFDWSTSRGESDHASIRWAAFYSDCEHEVLDVISGHRITLTYNLYAARGNGLMAGYAPALDAAHLPLCQLLGEVLSEEKFMEKGGLLGFFCAHSYPHTSTNYTLFPEMLKGADMAVWETTKSLGLDASVHAVILRDKGERETIYGRRYMTRWGDGHDKDGNGNPVPNGWISDKFDVQIIPETTQGMGDAELKLLRDWSSGAPRFRKVKWVTPWKGGHDSGELQIAGICMGNESILECMYSWCCIIVRVPSLKKRSAPAVVHDSDMDEDGDEDEDEESEAEDYDCYHCGLTQLGGCECEHPM